MLKIGYLGIGVQDDVRGHVLQPPYGTLPAVVKINKFRQIRCFGSKDYTK